MSSEDISFCLSVLKAGFAMDLLTQYYYSNNADQLSRTQVKHQAGIVDWFESAFPEGSSVLDIGAGSGVHLARLLDRDHEAHGIEPCQAFISGAEAMYPQVQGRILEDSLPYLHEVPDVRFDGVLCSAVLMHLPEEQLFEAAFNLRRILRPGGTILASLPLDRDGMPLRGRDTRGLLFNGLSPLKLELVLSRLGFSCIGRGESPDIYGRKGRRMGIRLFVMDGEAENCGMDRIHQALRREDETTTYSVAFIRALAEIGLTRYNSVRCLNDDSVAIPVGAIAQKWLEMYWPLIESRDFIPQIRGAAPNAVRAISFRQFLSEAVALFRDRKGLDGFILACRSRQLGADDMAVYKKLMARLCDTIRLGALLHTREHEEDKPLYGYDGRTRSIVVDRDLWKTFSLGGAAIRDAATLRWADLTVRFSEGAVDRDRALRLLIRPPLPDSQMSHVHRACLDAGEVRCVWTGRSLEPENLEVVRAIPFTLWRNNDLWNLFPVQEAVLPRQGLPTRRLLLDRKRAIIDHWSLLDSCFHERFRAESAFLAGAIITHQRNWPQRLFSLFVEAVEFTARQLKTDRWEP